MGFDLRELRKLDRAFSKVRSEIASGAGGLRSRLERDMGRLDAGQNVQVFKRETDPETGRKWERLSPRYAKWKRKNSRSRKVLVLGGDLKRSLITRRQTGERVIRLQGMTMHLGTTHYLGGIHMRGNARGNLPPRPMVGKTQRQLRAQAAAARKQIQDRMGAILKGSAGGQLRRSANRIKPDPRRW